jgi:hypothetical protein
MLRLKNLKTTSVIDEMNHLSKMESTKLDLLNEMKRVMKSPRPSRRADPTAAWNATQRWLYDGKAENYEKLRKLCLRRIESDESAGDLGDQLYEDYFMDWVADITRKDTLDEKIEKGEKINFNALYWWYRQFVQRASMKAAQDAHSRARGARTQSELSLNRPHLHDIDKMEGTGFATANVVYNLDAETGAQIGEPDYYIEEYESPVEQELHMESVYTQVKNLLTDRHGVEEGSLKYKLFEQMMEGKGGFQNKDEWAASWGVSRSVLNKRIEAVEKLLQRNKSLFYP